MVKSEGIMGDALLLRPKGLGDDKKGIYKSGRIGLVSQLCQGSSAKLKKQKTRLMKIGFLTPEYPHPKAGSSGGLGSSIKNLTISLVKKGVKVYVFLYSQDEEMEISENGVEISFIRHRKFFVGGWFFYRKYLEKVVNRKIIEHNIQVLEAPDWTGISAFMRFKCPLVMRLNGSDAYFCHLEGRPQKKRNFLLERRAFLEADAIISVSAYTAKKTKVLFGKEPEMRIIPNSVDLELFYPGEGKVRPAQLLYFGTMIRKKGVLELACIFNYVVKHYPQSQLLLVGREVLDGKEKRSTLALFNEKLSDDARSQVRFVGEVEYHKVREIIASSAVVLLPSFAEALPMAWLEAMAMKKAVVATNIGWAKEVMIDGKTGYLANPKNHTAFAEKVLRLLKNSELAQEMGKAARRQVELKFSAEAVSEKNMKFYSELIEKYGHEKKSGKGYFLFRDPGKGRSLIGGSWKTEADLKVQQSKSI